MTYDEFPRVHIETQTQPDLCLVRWLVLLLVACLNLSLSLHSRSSSVLRKLTEDPVNISSILPDLSIPTTRINNPFLSQHSTAPRNLNLQRFPPKIFPQLLSQNHIPNRDPSSLPDNMHFRPSFLFIIHHIPSQKGRSSNRRLKSQHIAITSLCSCKFPSPVPRKCLVCYCSWHIGAGIAFISLEIFEQGGSHEWISGNEDWVRGERI